MRRLLAACSLVFLLPSAVRASSPFLSEIAWAGSSASLADEWVEICAAPGTDLSGWSIEGAAGSPIVLPDGSAAPASGAFLVANYAADDPKSTLAAAPHLVTTAVSLSNSALALALRDATGVVVDTAGDGGAPEAGSNAAPKASMERVGITTWMTTSTSSGFDDGAAELGTPGSCASFEEASAPDLPAREDSATSTILVPEPEPAPDAATEPSEPPAPPMAAIRVSEIYPSPLSGEKEWLELVNRSDIGEFLDGWSVEDARGTKTTLAGLLMPWSRLVIESPKGSLNNDGDLVLLRDAEGRAIDRVEYPDIGRGRAYMRVELQDTFVVTRTPTPGAANVFTQPEPVTPTKAVAETASKPRPEAAAPIAPDAPLRHPVVLSEAKGPFPEREPSPRNVAAQDDMKKTKKPAAKPKAAAAPRYKGAPFVATVVVPPGVYAKTRAYVQRGGAIEELRLSKAPTTPWNVGDRVSFVAQSKSEGAVSFLLANPNSVRTIASASATFATVESWPEEAGGYGFIAEIASIRGDALEVTLGGVEGDVLAPAGTASALKPGDAVRVEGFVAPGPRPRVVLPYAHALRLFKTRLPEDVGPRTRPMRLPAPFAVGLTAAAGGVGLFAYLRMQRLKRLALLHAPVEDGSWE